jgi:transposase
MATSKVEGPDFGANKCPDCGAIMKPVSLGDPHDPSASVFECPKCKLRLDAAPGKPLSPSS